MEMTLWAKPMPENCKKCPLLIEITEACFPTAYYCAKCAAIETDLNKRPVDCPLHDYKDLISKPAAQKKEKATPAELMELLKDSTLSGSVQERLKDWLTYKKNKYEILGFQKLLALTARNVRAHGEQAVCDLIDECIANAWEGIIWVKLKPKGKAAAARTRNYDLEEG